MVLEKFSFIIQKSLSAEIFESVFIFARKHVFWAIQFSHKYVQLIKNLISIDDLANYV